MRFYETWATQTAPSLLQLFTASEVPWPLLCYYIRLKYTQIMYMYVGKAETCPIVTQDLTTIHEGCHIFCCPISQKCGHFWPPSWHILLTLQWRPLLPSENWILTVMWVGVCLPWSSSPQNSNGWYQTNKDQLIVTIQTPSNVFHHRCGPWLSKSASALTHLSPWSTTHTHVKPHSGYTYRTEKTLHFSLFPSLKFPFNSASLQKGSSFQSQSWHLWKQCKL